MPWGRKRYGNPDDNQDGIFGTIRPLPATVVNTTIIGEGFTDAVVGFQDMTILLEVKRPGKKNALRPSQEKFRREWRGGPILTVDDGADAIQQLINLDRRTPPVRGRLKPDAAQQVLTQCLAAAEGLVVDEHDLPGLIRKLRGTK